MKNVKYSVIIIEMIVILLAFNSKCLAGTIYYIAPPPVGNDITGNGSQNNPWATITHATGNMQGGDTLILKDGTYTGIENQLSPPSGTPQEYTIIKAENNWKAIIDGSDISGEYDYPIDISDSEYIQIEGLSLRNKSNSEIVAIWSSHHIKFLRSSVVNKLNFAGSIVRVSGDSHHVLFEDIWVTGAGRYGIIVFKPTAYPDQAPHQVILRRCVIRHDYRRRDENPTGEQVYPTHGIKIYGAQPGDNSVLVTRDILVQNCIALDCNYGEEYFQNDGGMGTTARTNNIMFYGCIVLNINGKGTCLPDPWGCNYLSVFSGYQFGDSARLGNGGDFTFVNNIAWDTSGSGFWFAGGTDTTKTVLIEGNTVGAIDGDQGNGPRAIVNVYSKLQAMVKNNLFYETGLPSPRYGPGDGGTYIEDYNWYYPESLVNTTYDTNYITNPSDIKYIIITPDAGTGEGGANRGATILKRYGEDGTLWDDPGYDQLTDNDLWPWPYEDAIKTAFTEENNPPENAYPQTNNVKRGFCADGTGLYGGPITLTSYIWEYLGNPLPEYLYGAVLVKGDINGDSEINIQDVQLCINVILGTETFSDIVERTDVVCDGITDESDINKIEEIILQKQ